MEQKIKYVVKRNKWNAFSEKLLAPLCENDPFVSLSDWKAEVESSDMGLFNVWDANGDMIAVFLIRIDNSPKADELVIVAAAGNTPKEEDGQGLYDVITPYVVQLARKIGCKYMRAHTERKGVAKLMERAGYTLDEYVCRLAVDNVQ